MSDKREYGIDALKTVAMLFVVINHILFWGGYGVDVSGYSAKAIGLKLIDAVAICAVNVFVLSSGWIMSCKIWRWSRIVELWATVVFYSLIIAAIAKWFLGVEFGMRIWLHSIMPVGCNQYWFFTVYFGLFFSMPVLNKLIASLSEREGVLFVYVGLVMFSLYPWLQRHDLFAIHDGYSLIWFMYLYSLAGIAKRNLWLDKLRVWHGIALVVLGALGSVSLPVIHERLSEIVGLKPILGIFSAYTSPLLVMESLGFLLLFSKLRIDGGRLRGILRLTAPSIFTVYIIHSNKLFRQMVKWNDFWSDYLQNNSFAYSVLGTLVAAALIFSYCILVDQVRILLFRKFNAK